MCADLAGGVNGGGEGNEEISGALLRPVAVPAGAHGGLGGRALCAHRNNTIASVQNERKA